VVCATVSGDLDDRVVLAGAVSRYASEHHRPDGSPPNQVRDQCTLRVDQVRFPPTKPPFFTQSTVVQAARLRVVAVAGPAGSSILRLLEEVDCDAFVLIAAMNPYPSGYHGDFRRACTCAAGAVIRYQTKWSTGDQGQNRDHIRECLG
jgi:hypothetical protein